MPLGAVGSQGSGGEQICHITGFRIRALGVGNLRFRLLSMDDIYTQTLNPMVMTSATNIQPMRLANFVQQRATLEVSITGPDESFTVSRIIIYAKPLFTMHPA